MPSQATNQAVSAVFLIAFTSSLFGCVLFTLLLRRWANFTIPLAFACVFEVIGYGIRSSRAASHWSAQLFVAVTIFLTIAPSFVSMAIYTTMERTLQILGKGHSLINPGWYVYLIFVDLAGLALQLVGLALALSGISDTAGLSADANKGGVVVAVGIGLHAATLAVFMVLFAVVLFQAVATYREFGTTTTDLELGVRGKEVKALTRRFKGYLAVVALAVACLLVRDLFRAIGLAHGFTTANVGQAIFALLDGFLVAEAVLGLVVFHPAWVLVDGRKTESNAQGKEVIRLGFHGNNFI